MRLSRNILTLIVTALATAASAQTTIKVDVNLVDLAFVARDAQGQLVGNLTRDDIELYEDAVPQKIHTFAKSTDLPLTLGLIIDVSGSQDPFGKKHKKDLEVISRVPPSRFWRTTRDSTAKRAIFQSLGRGKTAISVRRSTTPSTTALPRSSCRSLDARRF